MMQLLSIFLQIPSHVHPIWDNVFFYLFIIVFLIFSFVIGITMNAMKRRGAEAILQQQQNVARIDTIRKEHADTLEKIRIEMLSREEERGRQWMESEKETLRVLTGVSTLLDLSDKIGRLESEKILEKLEEIQQKVEAKSEK